MKSSKPSLLLLYCGGTIGMRQDVVTSALTPFLSAKDLVGTDPSLKREFSIRTQTIINIDSTNMQPKHWEEIAKRIVDQYEDYDGFVVAHGTDTMSYTASAVSFALHDLGKPVVFTGAQVPPDIIGSDAMANLIHAFQVASMDFAEVAIVFGDMILRGNRSMKASESQRNAFICPVFPPLGYIRLQPELTYPNIRRRHSGMVELQNGFEGNVAMIKCVPGMSGSVLDSIIDSGIEGLILETFGPGNVPNQEHSLLPSIKKAKQKNIPIVICTQCIFGSTRMYLYEVGRQAMELGVIPSRDMTPESAFVKLKWALARTRDPKEIADLFDKDLAGEVTL